MILSEGTLDLRRHKEHLKAIRRGDIPQEEIIKWFSEKEKQLDILYQTSKLPYGPNEKQIKTLLLSCLEHHYGSLDKAIVLPSKFLDLYNDILKVLHSYS